MPTVIYPPNYGRSSGTLSKRRFANVTKRWPLGGANEGNITPFAGLVFDAGMFGYRHADGTLRLGIGAAFEQPLFILDDYDAYDVTEANKVPYMPRGNYTVETSAIVAGVYASGDLVQVSSANPGLLEKTVGAPVAGVAQFSVEESRNETLPSGSVVNVIRITPLLQ